MGARWSVMRGLLLGAAAATLAVGCGYQPLGASDPTRAGLRVAVEPITNETFRPGSRAVAGRSCASFAGASCARRKSPPT
jgi:hypothetical protein